MKDLKKVSGLPLKLDGSKLVFGEMADYSVSSRTIEELRDVLIDKNANGPKECYYMYRDVYLPTHKELFRQQNIRYDITVLVPGKIGSEFVKTHGHHHANVPGTQLTYPEVYEVLQGNATFVAQSETEFFVCEAKAGQKFVVPPNFGHVTINSGKDALVIANLVERNFQSNYEEFKARRGACYYLTQKGWQKNENYGVQPPLKKVKPTKATKLGLAKAPLYSAFVKSPKKFAWLVEPQKFAKEFERLKK